MNRVAMLVALIAALVGGALSFLYFQRAERQLSGGDKVALLSLVKDVGAGDALTDEVLAVREVPVAYVEDRAVKAAEKPRVLGLHVDQDLRAGQTLMWSDMAITAAETRDLSSLVQPGRRALTVHSSDRSFLMVQPGDYVDVLATVATNKVDQMSVVLLQKVLVLASGNKTRRKEKEENKRIPTLSALTLSVTLEEAQLLSLAANKVGSRLVVVLRNPADDLIVPRTSNIESVALRDLEERAKIKGRIQQPVPTKDQGPVRLIQQKVKKQSSRR